MLPVSFFSVDITYSGFPFNLAIAISTTDSLPLSANSSICSSHEVVSASLLPLKELITSNAACCNWFLARHWKLSTNFSLMLSNISRPALIILMDLLLLSGYSHHSFCCLLGLGFASTSWLYLSFLLLPACCCSHLLATFCNWFISSLARFTVLPFWNLQAPTCFTHGWVLGAIFLVWLFVIISSCHEKCSVCGWAGSCWGGNSPAGFLVAPQLSILGGYLWLLFTDASAMGTLNCLAQIFTSFGIKKCGSNS